MPAMPTFPLAFLIAALATATPHQAFADEIQKTVKHVSATDLKKSCDRAGGSFERVEDQYGCYNHKKGTSVVCDAKKCTGTTKTMLRPEPRRQSGSGAPSAGIARNSERAKPRTDGPVLQRDGVRINPGRRLQQIE